jgi:histidinol dehydrogenase
LIDYTGPENWPAIKQWLMERENPETSVEEPVRGILDDVRNRGDKVLVEWTRKFDCPDFTSDQLRVPVEHLERAMAEIPESDLAIIREAADNIRTFHENQKQKSWVTTQEDGTVLGQMVRPVDRAGLYVPGGQGGETPLISSLLMNAIPAQVAGVERILVISPPRKEGTLNPYILATAGLLGLTEVYQCGSAWGIAALAFGTATIDPVDVIAGPGNIFVTTAKRLLVGKVGIDMIAGPSEIAILADSTADPEHLAADMLSQAEHDPLASALLISPDKELLRKTAEALEEQTARLPRNEIAAKSLTTWGGLVAVPDLDTGMDLINLLAPEHFELAVDSPWAWLGKVRNAGAVFLGHDSAEPVGDYFAGPNHVLPTLSTARFSSALSVDTFCKKISLIAPSPGYVREHGAKIARLARLEALEAHARSVERRIGD